MKRGLETWLKLGNLKNPEKRWSPGANGQVQGEALAKKPGGPESSWDIDKMLNWENSKQWLVIWWTNKPYLLDTQSATQVGEDEQLQEEQGQGRHSQRRANLTGLEPQTIYKHG